MGSILSFARLFVILFSMKYTFGQYSCSGYNRNSNTYVHFNKPDLCVTDISCNFGDSELHINWSPPAIKVYFLAYIVTVTWGDGRTINSTSTTTSQTNATFKFNFMSNTTYMISIAREETHENNTYAAFNTTKVCRAPASTIMNTTNILSSTQFTVLPAGCNTQECTTEGTYWRETVSSTESNSETKESFVLLDTSIRTRYIVILTTGAVLCTVGVFSLVYAVILRRRNLTFRKDIPIDHDLVEEGYDRLDLEQVNPTENNYDQLQGENVTDPGNTVNGSSISKADNQDEHQYLDLI